MTGDGKWRGQVNLPRSFPIFNTTVYLRISLRRKGVVGRVRTSDFLTHTACGASIRRQVWRGCPRIGGAGPYDNHGPRALPLLVEGNGFKLMNLPRWALHLFSMRPHHRPEQSSRLFLPEV